MLRFLASNVVCKDLLGLHSSRGHVLQQDDPLPKIEARRFEQTWRNACTTHTQQADALMLLKCEATLPDLRQQQDREPCQNHVSRKSC